MKNKSVRSWELRVGSVALIVLMLLSVYASAQNKTPILERNITLKLTNEKLGMALTRISQQGSFTFSYNPSILDVNRVVNLNVTNKSVREVLNIIFRGKIEYKVKGNYVILQKSKEESKTETQSETFVVSGYITSPDGDKLQWVSIYDKRSLNSSVTNSYGYYKITLDKEQPNILLNISKQEYKDTTVEIKYNTNQFLNITVSKRPEPIPVIMPLAKADSVIPAKKPEEADVILPGLISTENLANTKNIKDTIYRSSQFSVLPFIGTNAKLSANVINDYSVNLIGGYSLGTRKLEVGGLFNADRGDVEVCQLAGFGNAVGGNVKYCQMAGFANTVRKNVSGFQAAGFFNLTWENQSGAQMAGYFNVVKGKMRGAQFAGFFNTVIDSVNAVQFAGYLNVATKTLKGGQVAGFTNVVIDRAQGTQIAGFTNVATDSAVLAQVSAFCNVTTGTLTGTQVSAFSNVTVGELTGSQVGIFNYAKKVYGAQVGIINVTDTVKGVSFGLLSYVHKGYHKIEVSADEIFYTNVAFRTGTHYFHNIITAGFKPFVTDTNIWTFGYGLGTTARVSRTIGIDFDITSNQIVKGNDFNAINLNNKAYLGVDIKLAPKLSLAVGGTVNGQLTKTSYDKYPNIFTDNQPDIFYEKSYLDSDLTLKMWFGGKVALRFM